MKKTGEKGKNKKSAKQTIVKKAAPKRRMEASSNPYGTELLDRLKKYVVEKKGDTLTDLAVSIGVHKSFFTTIKRQNSAIGSDKLIKILKHYPELSAEWLLRGTGVMLVGARSDEDVNFRFNLDKLIPRLATEMSDLSDSVDSIIGLVRKIQKAKKGIEIDQL